MTGQGFGVVRPLPGNGLVAHMGGLLLVCDAAEAVVSDLLAAVRETAASGGDGRALARRIAQVLARTMTGEPPSCAVAGPAGGGIAVLVSGEASAVVRSPTGEIALAGRDSLTWTDRLITGPVQAVELRLPSAGPAHPQVRLDDGVVVGGGISCDFSETAGRRADLPPLSSTPAPDQMAPPAREPEARPAPPPPPPPTPASDPLAPYPLGGDRPMPSPTPQPSGFSTAQPSDPFLLPPPGQGRPLEQQPSPPPPGSGGTGPMSVPVPGAEDAGAANGRMAEPGEPRERGAVPPPPGPGGGQAEAEGGTEQSESGPLVYGVDCKNDHFNDPRVPYCAVCGIALSQRSLVPYKGPRPPLGVLLLDDGVTLRLDTDYLLGRDPERAAEVTSGQAKPAKITSPDGSVSRRHLRVALDGWDVNLIDLGSVNGTQIQPPGDPNFYDIPPNEPVTIAPGTTVRIGVSRTMRYESHRTR